MISLSDVRDARERVDEVARHTPLERSRSFSEMSGADLHLKLENFQRTGAFKIRGAMNRIATLSDAEREADRAGVDATVVMPKFAPVSKVKATRGYGASVRLEGVDYDEAQAYAHELEREESRTYVHAFDDPVVMAGQGTLGLEIVDDCPQLDTVVVPIG
ncbi:threonine ammonia-lyase, partial [Halorubrum sp. E3]